LTGPAWNFRAYALDFHSGLKTLQILEGSNA